MHNANASIFHGGRGLVKFAMHAHTN